MSRYSLRDINNGEIISYVNSLIIFRDILIPQMKEMEIENTKKNHYLKPLYIVDLCDVVNSTASEGDIKNFIPVEFHKTFAVIKKSSLKCLPPVEVIKEQYSEMDGLMGPFLVIDHFGTEDEKHADFFMSHVKQSYELMERLSILRDMAQGDLSNPDFTLVLFRDIEVCENALRETLTKIADYGLNEHIIGG